MLRSLAEICISLKVLTPLESVNMLQMLMLAGSIARRVMDTPPGGVFLFLNHIIWCHNLR